MERSALARIGIHANLTRVFLNDSVCYRETQTRTARLAFTRRCLGGKERIVNPGDVLGRDSRATVADADLDSGAVGGADPQRAPVGRHGVFGVQEKVQEHLLQLSRIAVDRRQAFI